VPEALKHISSQTFEVLLSDLHTPGAGDGLTVVSAMRHANPKAVTILLSAFPEMNAAAHAILLQADEILVKPMNVEALVAAIKTEAGEWISWYARGGDGGCDSRPLGRKYYWRMAQTHWDGRESDVCFDELRGTLQPSTASIPGSGVSSALFEASWEQRADISSSR
jgi:CheY-like chemotaxis protein